MEWPKHTIYWTICSMLVIGVLVGSIITMETYEARAEGEEIGTYVKAKMVLATILYSAAVYLAGTEYHELKRKIKKD